MNKQQFDDAMGAAGVDSYANMAPRTRVIHDAVRSLLPDAQTENKAASEADHLRFTLRLANEEIAKLRSRCTAAEAYAAVERDFANECLADRKKTENERDSAREAITLLHSLRDRTEQERDDAREALAVATKERDKDIAEAIAAALDRIEHDAIGNSDVSLDSFDALLEIIAEYKKEA